MRLALLWVAAAAISGFTLRRHLGPLDEGILMQAATRMAGGQWPWRDFAWSYGPGEPLVVMLLGKAFGPSLLWWRLLRVAADATAALLVYALVRDRRPRWALAAWAAAALTAAQPTSANPTAPALAFALGAVLAATRARPGLAGVLAAVAAFWRPDVGAIAALAAAATLLMAARDARTTGASSPDARARRATAEPAPASVAGASHGEPASAADAPLAGPASTGGAPASAAGLPLTGPASAAGAPLAGPASTGGAPPAGPASGAGLPLTGPASAAGAPLAGPASTGGAPPAGPASAAGALACLGVAALVLVVLYAPFLVAAGPVTVWDALVVQSTRDGAWWRLPLGFQGGDVKDFVTWLLPFAAIVVLVLAARRRTIGLFVLGVGAVVYYVSRADLEHAQGLLVVAAAAAALIRPKVAGATVLALLIAVGAANRASALFRPPSLAPFESVRIPPEEAAALPAVISAVHRLVPPGEPIYVAPRRSDLVTFSDPLLYYLADRPNVLHRDFLLQAKPEEQRRIVAALQHARPKAIVRWLAPASAQPEPNRRGRPSGSTALDDYLATAYREQARFGDYALLVPRY